MCRSMCRRHDLARSFHSKKKPNGHVCLARFGHKIKQACPCGVAKRKGSSGHLSPRHSLRRRVGWTTTSSSSSLVTLGCRVRSCGGGGHDTNSDPPEMPAARPAMATAAAGTPCSPGVRPDGSFIISEAKGKTLGGRCGIMPSFARRGGCGTWQLRVALRPPVRPCSAPARVHVTPRGNSHELRSGHDSSFFFGWSEQREAAPCLNSEPDTEMSRVSRHPSIILQHLAAFVAPVNALQ